MSSSPLVPSLRFWVLALLVSTVLIQPVRAQPTPVSGEDLAAENARLRAENLALQGQLALGEGRFSEAMLLGQAAGPDYWEPIRQAEPTLLRYLHGHSAFVSALAYSPDGSLLASGSADSFIQLWDTATSQPYLPFVLAEPGGVVTALAFSPDGQLLASAHERGMVVLWDALSGARLSRLMGHTDQVQALAFHPAGQILASASVDGTVRLWDIPSGTPNGEALQNRETRISYTSLAFSIDGHALAGGDSRGGISLWQTESRERIARLDDHRDRITGLRFTPDGKQLISGSWDGRINLWDLRERRVVSSAEGLGTLNGLSLNPDGDWLAAASDRLHFWRISERSLEANLSQPSPENLALTAIQINPTAAVIAVATGDGVLLWNPLNIAREPAITPCDIVGRNPTTSELAVDAMLSVDSDGLCPQFPPHYSRLNTLLDEARQATGESSRSLFEQAAQINGWPGMSYSVCWYGSKAGFAAEVLPACESAVLGAPDSAQHRDARGLARALTGNLEGAIADFSAYVTWGREVNMDAATVAQRSEWILALRAGNSPFTLEMLSTLP
ncbi:MAG: WD40 repeat domain-containing protein [Anaerolineae bacterium]|nr:WD40 repeat domain-containing protein [Anaerolineae bacterium]